MPEKNQLMLNRIVAETVVINPPQFPERRAASVALCDALSLEPIRFSEGTTGLPHQLACTRAHRVAMQSLTQWPSLVLEDDLELNAQAGTLASLPEDADIIYLSVSAFGCLPWSGKNLGIARHRALKGLTLASEYDADWLKLHSMSGGQAIMYVTEKGRDAWLQATMQAERFGGPFDVFTAYAMKDVNVYAPHLPMFTEAAALQRQSLRDNKTLLDRRLSYTKGALRRFSSGEQTTVHFKGQTIIVEAEQTAEHQMQWKVISAERPE